MEKSEKLKGEIYVMLSSLFWATFPVLIVLAGVSLTGISFIAWSVVIAALFFIFVILYKGSFSQLNNKLLWKYALYIGIINGLFYYFFYSLSLEYTSPGNLSVIGLFEIFTSFVFFNLYKKEFMSRDHIIGGLLMVLGALIIVGNKFSGINIGDIFALLMVMVSPFGNYFQQKARKIVNAEVLLFARNIVTIPLIFTLIYVLGYDIWVALDLKIVLMLLFSGIFLLGFSRILWIESIHRISVTKGIALASFGPLYTLGLAWLLLNQAPTIFQIASFIPLVAGLLLLTDNLNLSRFGIGPKQTER